MAIIGILAAIAIPNYLGMQRKAKTRHAIASADSQAEELLSWMQAINNNENNVVDCDGDGVLEADTQTTCGADVAAAMAQFITLHADGGVDPEYSACDGTLDLYVAGNACAAGTEGQVLLSNPGAGNSVLIIACDCDANEAYRRTISVE
jgi:Tfp pilus assembly protein PilE